jgi:predicted small secreted protein
MERDLSERISRATIILVAIALIASAALVAACATTRQSRGIGEASGFLGDYSDLREGGKDEPQLIYIRPDVDWARYDAIQLESVTLWRDQRTEDVPKEEQQILTDFLYNSLYTELSKDYKMVDQPGPNVLRLRAAITEAKGSRAVMDTITSVVPQLRLLTTIVGMSAGTSVLVGKAGVEAEITDSISGKRLAAGLDERQGTKAMRGGIKTWSDVKLAFEFWSERLRKRLATLSGRTIED